MTTSKSAVRNYGATFALVLAMGGMAAPVAAAPLIRFTDGNPDAVIEAFLNDTGANWAVSWTQTVASTNVSLSAILNSYVGATTGGWYVTSTIGAGTTAADVFYSGSYNIGALPSNQLFDFNNAPRTVLGTGLSFAPGTYFLVLDGPAGTGLRPGTWVGDSGAVVSLAPGFSVGSYLFSSTPAAFAPATIFNTSRSSSFVFELDANTAAVPLPASLPLMAAGLAMLGLSRRRPTARS